MTRLNLGGPARQVLGSDPLLRARGHELRLFTGEPLEGEGDLVLEARALGLDVVRVPGLGRSVRPLADRRAGRFLAQALGAWQPDLVHTHASKAGCLGRRAALSLRRVPRLVHTFHGHVLEGYFPRAIELGLRAAERRMARRTDALVAVSEATGRDLERFGIAGRRPTRIIPPGMDLDALLEIPPLGEERTRGGAALRQRLGIGNETVLALMLGRLAEVKRPRLALEALAGTDAVRAGRLALVFAGDGPERAGLEAAASQMPADQPVCVHLLGAIADTHDLLSGCDLVIGASRTEGLPVALIEAGAAARPAVWSDVGGVAQILEDGATGKLLPAEPAELVPALSRALDAAVAEPAIGRALGLAARAHVAQRHGAARLADDLEQLYSELLASRPAEVA